MDTYLQAAKKQVPSSMDSLYAHYLNYGWPLELIKACGDHYEYTIGLKSGDVIEFTDAEAISPEWVLLTSENSGGSRVETSIDYHSRGISIRVSEIAWIVDGYK